MRISINQECCTGCGVCVSYCPDAFRFDRKGKVVVRYWDVPVNIEQDCKEASEICPGEAIDIVLLS
ncbi:MAG: ferredoxin [Fibrobacter sp.]|nr:ferredoxin [Fibrobacter sp.]